MQDIHRPLDDDHCPFSTLGVHMRDKSPSVLCLTAISIIYGSLMLPGKAVAQPAYSVSEVAGRQPSAAILTDPYKEAVSVGVVGAYMPDYEGSNDYRLYPAPIAFGSIDRYAFALIDNQLNVDLIRNRPGPVWDIQAGPVVHLTFDRAGKSWVHDVRVRALGSLGTAIEVGGFVGVAKTGVITSPYDNLSLTLGYRHDIAGVSDGTILQPILNYTTPLSSKAALNLSASAEIVDRKYARTYYSVSAAQASLSGLSAFDAHGGLKNWKAGIQAQYALSGTLLHGFSIIAGGDYGLMEGSISRSPLIRQAGLAKQFTITFGIIDTF